MGALAGFDFGAEWNAPTAVETAPSREQPLVDPADNGAVVYAEAGSEISDGELAGC